MKIEEVPERYQKMYHKAMTGKSLKTAIKAHCSMCMGWDLHAVKGCTATGCPLYPHRPVGKSAKAGPKDAKNDTSSRAKATVGVGTT